MHNEYKMNFVLVILIVFILIVSIFNYLIFREKRAKYLKAGKKWDEIVKELSRRK